MNYPKGSDYLLVMQHPQQALTSPAFVGATVEQTPLGLPMPRSGGAVFTFHLTLRGGEQRAVRCYNRDFPDLFERYAQISAAVTRAPAGLFSAIDFQPNGIRVNQGTYPILVMDWVAGKPLAAWIESHLTASAIRPLIGQWDRLVEQLGLLGIAHGDLQHGNILVDTQNQLRLIDYDSMYVPALRTYGANDAGHRNYQHPRRNSAYDERLDRFAALVIGLALRALAEDPTLWHEFGRSGENMLLTRDDFVQPQQSKVLQRLERIPAVAPYIANFRAYCQGRYEDVPTLHQFFAQRNSVQVAKVSGAVQPWATTTPIAHATDTRGLRARVGQLVEIIGQIRDVECAVDKNGNDFVRLVFTDRRGFVALIFATGLERYQAAGRDPDDLQGCWVTITQVVEGYTDQQHPEWLPRPQVLIEYPAQVGVLTSAEAQMRLRAPVSLPRGLTTRPNPAPVMPPKTLTERERAELEHANKYNELWGNRSTPSPPSVPPARPPVTPVRATPPMPVAPMPKGLITTQKSLPPSPPPVSTPAPLPAPAPRTWWEAFQAFWRDLFTPH